MNAALVRTRRLDCTLRTGLKVIAAAYRCTLVFALAFVAQASAGHGAAAPSSDGIYVLDWHSIDAGTPQTSSSATFRVRGSVGQPDVGSVGGGVFRIDGGFWSSAAPLGGGDGGLFADGFEAVP